MPNFKQAFEIDFGAHFRWMNSIYVREDDVDDDDELRVRAIARFDTERWGDIKPEHQHKEKFNPYAKVIAGTYLNRSWVES